MTGWMKGKNYCFARHEREYEGRLIACLKQDSVTVVFLKNLVIFKNNYVNFKTNLFITRTSAMNLGQIQS